MPRDAQWIGDLELGDGWAVWSGVVGDGRLHRHFAAQAVISPDPVTVFDGLGIAHNGHSILIDPLTDHRLLPGVQAQILYIEPMGCCGERLDDLLEPWRRTQPSAVFAGPTRFWSRWLAGEGSAMKESGARIANAVASIDAMLPQGAVMLESVASSCSLSSEHFRHLFVDQTGLNFRRYVLWRRLRLAALELAEGSDVTQAAYAAGFADSAHFARTLKSTFGVTATQALLPSLPC